MTILVFGTSFCLMVIAITLIPYAILAVLYPTAQNYVETIIRGADILLCIILFSFLLVGVLESVKIFEYQKVNTDDTPSSPNGTPPSPKFRNKNKTNSGSESESESEKTKSEDKTNSSLETNEEMKTHQVGNFS